MYHKRRFDRLFASGDSFVIYPFRVIFFVADREEGDFPVRVAVSVSKKRFKRAVKRNRVKRLSRESYRLNKNCLYESIPERKTVDMLFIYLHEEILEYAKFEKAMAGVIKKMGDYFEAHADLDSVVAD